MYAAWSTLYLSSVGNHTSWRGGFIVQKKLDKLDGLWLPQKEIIGWIIGDEKYSRQLPPYNVDKALGYLKKIKNFKHKIPQKLLLYKVTGSLEHASFQIPGSTILFSPI